MLRSSILNRRNRWLAGFTLCLALACTTVTRPLAAQENDESDSEFLRSPLVTFNVASVERLLTNVDYMFLLADRPEMAELSNALLSRVGDLKGLDRNKPLGVMLFLEGGFPPSAQPLTYIPVDNIEDLMKTVSLGPVVPRKVDGREDRYEILVTGRREQTFNVRLKDGYAFIAQDDSLLDDDKLLRPERFANSLSERYDIALDVNITSVPQGLRGLLMTYINSASQAELQQRDDEPEGAFRIRRANGQSTLAFLEQLITQGDRIVLGAKADPEEKRVVLDVNLDATPDSKFAGYLKDIAGRPSYFESLAREDTPFLLSVSWMMDEREKSSTLEALQGIESEILRNITENEVDLEIQQPLEKIFRSLRSTVEAGHWDMFVQFLGNPQNRFVLTGGVRLVEAGEVGGALSQLLSQIDEEVAEVDVELNVESHRGINFHRLRGPEGRDGAQFWGEAPAALIGTGQNTLWFALGSEERAFETVQQDIDTVLADLEANKQREPTAPFRIVSHITPWLELRDRARRGPAPTQPRLANQAFDNGADSVQLDFRPTESGARLRLAFDEGFVRLVGLALARRYDRSNQ